MASGTIALTTNDTSWQVRLKWSSTTNASRNTSTISFTYQVYRNVTGNVSNTADYISWGRWSYVGGSAQDEVTNFPRLTVEARTWTTVSSWSWTVPHKADGTRTITIWGMVSADNGLESEFQRNITMTTIPKGATVTSAPNFNDTENPTITYSNPAGNNAEYLGVCISLNRDDAEIAYRDVSKTGSSYTFTLTENERNILRNNTLSGSNTRDVYFFVKSIVNGTTYYDYLQRTFTVINAAPTLSAIVLDDNEVTAALTGDRMSQVIKGYSNIAYEMSASALKGASIASYRATNGSDVKTAASGTFTGATSNTFKFTATDNRGLTASKEIKLNLINYFKPTCSQEVKIAFDGETEAAINIKIKGEFFNASFGAETNDIDIQFRHKTGDEDFTPWTSVSAVIWETYKKGNTYSTEGTISNIPYDQPFTIQSRVVDKLATVETAEYVAKLIPVFDWGKNDFNFNVPVSIQGNPLVDYVIERGTEPMGTNGTWYWSKWASGKAECYGKRNYGNMAINTAWSSVFYTSEAFTQDLPTGLFITTPDYIDINTNEAGFIMGSVLTPPGVSTTGAFKLVRPQAETLSQVYIRFHVIGRWK